MFGPVWMKVSKPVGPGPCGTAHQRQTLASPAARLHPLEQQRGVSTSPTRTYTPDRQRMRSTGTAPLHPHAKTALRAAPRTRPAAPSQQLPRRHAHLHSDAVGRAGRRRVSRTANQRRGRPTRSPHDATPCTMPAGSAGTAPTGPIWASPGSTPPTMNVLTAHHHKVMISCGLAAEPVAEVPEDHPTPATGRSRTPPRVAIETSCGRPSAPAP